MDCICGNKMLCEALDEGWETLWCPKCGTIANQTNQRDKEGNLTIYEWKVPQNLPQVELHDLLLANARNFISEYEKIINEVH